MRVVRFDRPPSAPRRRLLAACVAVAVLALGVPGVRAGDEPTSIFDDNFTGGELRPAPKHVAPPPPPPPVNDEPAPKPRPAAPKPAAPKPPPAPPVVRKLPAPTAEQQAAGEKAVREEYADRLADKSRPGRRYAADLLIARAGERAAAADPAARFAMQSLARDLAADAGDIRLSIRAVDALDAAYHVDGPRMRVDAFLRAKARFADVIDHSAAVSEGLQLIDDLTRIAQYKHLRLITPVVRSSAAKADNPSLASSVRQATADAEALAAEFDKAKQAADALKANPEDPAANLTVGRFLCLYRDDWRGGLPRLLKAADNDPLRALAGLESAGTIKGPALRQELAEGWWAYAEASRATPLLRKKAQARSCAWYNTIVGSLTGLEKIVAQKRLSDARANGVDVITPPADFGAASTTAGASRPPR